MNIASRAKHEGFVGECRLKEFKTRGEIFAKLREEFSQCWDSPVGQVIIFNRPFFKANGGGGDDTLLFKRLSSKLKHWNLNRDSLVRTRRRPWRDPEGIVTGAVSILNLGNQPGVQAFAAVAQKAGLSLSEFRNELSLPLIDDEWGDEHENVWMKLVHYVGWDGCQEVAEAWYPTPWGISENHQDAVELYSKNGIDVELQWLPSFSIVQDSRKSSVSVIDSMIAATPLPSFDVESCRDFLTAANLMILKVMLSFEHTGQYDDLRDAGVIKVGNADKSIAERLRRIIDKLPANEFQIVAGASEFRWVKRPQYRS